MILERKDILGIKELSKDEILLILDTADSFIEISTREIKKVPTLRGKTVINLFYEASTRTRTSFEIAGKRLSADTINISASTSSVVKGETLLDTARNLEAMNPDVIVIRHSAAGAPHMLAGMVKQSIINAGDGAHEHPTQALLDMMTIRTKKGHIENLNIAIVGDIAHSRVVRSNIYGLKKMGAQVTVAGPATMIPRDIEQMGVTVHSSLEEAIKEATHAIALKPDFIDPVAILGAAYHLQGNYAKAEYYWEEFLRKEPNDIMALSAALELYHLQGEKIKLRSTIGQLLYLSRNGDILDTIKSDKRKYFPYRPDLKKLLPILKNEFYLLVNDSTR